MAQHTPDQHGYLRAAPALEVIDGSLFRVHRIYCVGRNYAAHAREMGADPDREAPFFFSKPADAAVQASQIPYPPATKELHHEVELVVAIERDGADIPAEQALAHVFGYATGVDLTRRDLQANAKQRGQPWDMAKGFDCSAPLSRLVPAAEFLQPPQAPVSLRVNGVLRQAGSTDQMIWPVAEIIAALSRLVTLRAGDLVFTGTPEGVGPLHRGDRITAEIGGIPPLQFEIF